VAGYSPGEPPRTRERLAEHGDNACARACHSIFDPPGLAFENYDGIGAFRTMDGGKPVDASGIVRFPSGDTQLVVAIVKTPSFSYRTPSAGEVLR
jgi:hypothetical protein